MVPAVGAMLALSAALAAACFVKAFGVTFLGRPRTPAAAQARRGRPLLACRDVRPGRALPAGRHPAGLLHRCAGAGHAGAGRRAHAAAGRAAIGSRSCRSRESRSSYNGLLVFVFIASRPPARGRMPSIAWPRDALRRGPAWDCGFPDAEPGDAIHRRQLRAADPPRVRHASCSAPASKSTCRRRATSRPARFHVDAARPGLGRAVRCRSATLVDFAADRLNRAAVPDHPRAI